MFPYLKRAFRNSWLFPRYIGLVHIRQAMESAQTYAVGKLLDLGCGLRPYESIFADRVSSYIGMDWPRTADEARPDFIGDAMQLPISTDSIETVLATELMEHLPWPEKFLSEVARVLREGGTLILSVPFMEPLHEEPRDFYRFTPYSLRSLLERHGFRVERTWRKGGWWSVVLGSFVNQALYDWANPIVGQGRRRNNPLALVLVVPICTLAQFLGYTLDCFFKATKYTLGYVVAATFIGASRPVSLSEGTTALEARRWTLTY